MAEKQHIDLLHQGAEVWNQWREDENYVVPDLSWQDLREINIREMDLSKANLTGVNLSNEDLSNTYFDDANFSQANLNGANLSKAHLVGANFFLASLVGANLEKADLQAADFRHADLSNSNLSFTYLGGAILTDANLHSAHVMGAEFNATTLGDNDLTAVKGLEAIKHGAASIIGIQTLYRSRGDIPAAFLRGCGIPEEFISYIPSLFGQARDYYSCFISYSSKDEPVVSKIYNDLQKAGVRCWFAPQDLKAGEDFNSTIRDAIDASDKLLLVLSSNSVHSKWVELEVRKAIEKENLSNKSILFPVRLDDAVMETKSEWLRHLVESKHIGDFRQWQSADAYQRAVSQLIRDLTLSTAIESEDVGAK